MTMLKQMKQQLVRIIEDAVLSLRWVAKDEMPQVVLETPKEKRHGDFATNIAMQLSRFAKQPPRRIAEQLCEQMNLREAFVERVEIAGPGFINFFMKKSVLTQIVPLVLKEAGDYGKSAIGGKEKIQVEFVSANPTGSLHLGHARGAAVGDALCNILEAAGFDVTREYYINDAGNQVDNLAKSLEARYREALGRPAEMPEDGYYGEDIIAMAKELAAQEGDRLLGLSDVERRSFFRQYGLEKELAKIKDHLARFRVSFDVWFSETSLYRQNRISPVLDQLRQNGYVYDQDGAVWLRSTAFGDDKDRVLVKQDGSYTYLTPDIAYHDDKYKRGFSRIINIWGADHHGYIPRMKAAMAALGHNPDALEVLVVQMVSLFQGGKKVKMSKRTGKAVTLEDLMTEVGTDATRYFFTMRSVDTQLEFDMDLAVSQSNENPVYYVQYAHARICSIFRQAEEQGWSVASIMEPGDPAGLERLNMDVEYDLLRKIGDFPDIVGQSARKLEPHRVVRYVHELATLFHSYYNAERVLLDDRELSEARLKLLAAIRITIKNALALIGVSVPEQM
jgi:arginyl-tRNA synthetase